jgi:hypothetical protein
LRLAGVSAEVKKGGGRDVWYVKPPPTSLRLGARSSEKPSPRSSGGRRERLGGRRQGGALAGEAGEGPRVEGGLAEVPRGAGTSGALVVRFSSTNPDSIEREAQRLREMGLEEGVTSR